MFYGQHVDNAIRFAPDTGQRVRTDISATLFLSDPASYEGGELLGYRIKSPAASLIRCSAAPLCTSSSPPS